MFLFSKNPSQGEKGAQYEYRVVGECNTSEISSFSFFLINDSIRYMRVSDMGRDAMRFRFSFCTKDGEEKNEVEESSPRARFGRLVKFFSPLHISFMVALVGWP